MRYHVLKIESTLTKIVVCLGLLVGSYLASGLINASPITRPSMDGPRTRGLIVSPAAPAMTEPAPVDGRETGNPASPPVQSL